MHIRRAFPILLFFLSVGGRAESPLKNLAEYRLPLSSQKLVIAHCMTNIIRYRGHEFEDSCNPIYYSPKTSVTAQLGGMNQVYPLFDAMLKNATLEEAVEMELKAAQKSGIDGFQFYYTLGSRNWDKIIEAYFRVADRKQIDFKFTLCISHPSGSNEKNKIAELAERIHKIQLHVGKNNRHWLRTPDGRLIVYLWNGDSLANIPMASHKLPEAYYVARAYRRLADAVHERFACVSLINEAITPQKLSDVLDYFPAVWIWTLPYHDAYIGKYVAEQCRRRHRNFTASAFNDFYTSKLLKPGTWDMFHKAADAAAAGIKHVERKYIPTGLSFNFRKLLEFGIRQDAQIINIITWNDYPEGHHIAPEINHNDGFSILLNYYKNLWKKKPSPYSGKNVAIVFFKKYPGVRIPSPYNIPVINFEKESHPMPVEDSIEVVTLLPSAATLEVNGQRIKAGPGLTSSIFQSAPGQVNVTVSGNHYARIHFITPEGITCCPYRTDRLTYSYSSETSAYYTELFGARKIPYSSEYSSSPFTITK